MATRGADSSKNIWVAAGDGDLERVKHLIETEGLSPDVPDTNTYTPLHAAASYDQYDVLTYLLSKGGNINVTDDDGETPLFTVETVETARWLVAHGAEPGVLNLEGQTAADFLDEDSPEVAAYLRSLLPGGPASGGDDANEDDEDEDDDASADGDDDDAVGGLLTDGHLSSLMAERLTEAQTTALMGQFEEIMRQSEADGVNRDGELAELVQSALFGAVEAGRSTAAAEEPEPEPDAAASPKRARTQPDR